MASAGIGSELEGVHAVGAAMDAGRVVALTVESSRTGSGPVADLVTRAHSLGIPVSEVGDVRPLASTRSPQGVLARCRPIEPAPIDELAGAERPAIVVVDHVEDPQNLGAIARSAAAAGMTGMVVADVRAAPVGATAFKAAAGAFERIPVAVVSSIPAAMKRLRDAGIWTVGLSADGTESLFGLGLLTEPVAMIVGAEGAGLAELVRKRCDVVATIPMAGGSESLNASVAAALGCFEIRRARSGS